MNWWSILILCALLPISVDGQPLSRQQSVEGALLLMEEYYQVRFAYSKDVVPFRQMVYLEYRDKDLVQVLEDLGAQTGIIYRRRGSRVILSYDPGRLASVPTSHVVQHSVPFVLSPAEKVADEPLFEPDPPVIDSMIHRPSVEALAGLTIRRTEEVQQEDVERSIFLEERLFLDRQEERQWIQVTLIPAQYLTTRKEGKINHFSVNLVSGSTGGLQGLELGGIRNKVITDAQGLQVAGMFNRVNGNLDGMQLAGLGNYNVGIMRGAQLATIYNINSQTDGLQLAGIFNLNRRVSRAFQIAGLFNAGRNIAGGQIAGLTNVSMGRSYYQISPLCNFAENVHVQLGGIVNVAKNVKYVQLGLINVADSVQGISFGLLNLIRNGYNKIEISTSEILYGNIAIKLGTRRFYNTFSLGSNFRRNINNSGLVWGYGYGFGFMQKLASKMSINPEVIFTNIQESRIIKPELNLLGQMKLLMNFGQEDGFSLFVGPTLNAMLSRIVLPDLTLVGSQAAPTALYEKLVTGLDKPAILKLWVGFSAGIRI